MVKKKKKQKKVAKREFGMLVYTPTIEQLRARKAVEVLRKRAEEKRRKEQWKKLKKEEKERIERELKEEERKRELAKKEKWGIVPKKYERHVAVTKRVGGTIARGLRGYAEEFKKATNGGR